MTTKISSMTAGSALGGTEKLEMTQSGNTRYTTPDDVATYTGTSHKLGLIVMAHTSSAITMADGGNAVTNFNTEDYDGLSAYSAGTFTVPSGQGGYYEVRVANASIDPNGFGWDVESFVRFDVYKNGSYYATLDFFEITSTTADTGVYGWCSGSKVVPLAAADTASIHYVNASGHARKIDAGAAIEILRVR